MKKFLTGLLFGLFISLIARIVTIMLTDEKHYIPLEENIEKAPRTVDSISLGINERKSERPSYIKQSI